MKENDEENNDNIEDQTFNRLRNIQILIRKESSLKGLCKCYILIISHLK